MQDILFWIFPLGIYHKNISTICNAMWRNRSDSLTRQIRYIVPTSYCISKKALGKISKNWFFLGIFPQPVDPPPTVGED